jgi:hypothetical protein
VYTISVLEKENTGTLNLYLEYLSKSSSSAVRVDFLLGPEDNFEAEPYLINHPLSKKAMANWDFKLDSNQQDIVDDMFFISNQ